MEEVESLEKEDSLPESGLEENKDLPEMDEAMAQMVRAFVTAFRIAKKEDTATPALHLAQSDLPSFSGREDERPPDAWLREVEATFKPYGDTVREDTKLVMAARALENDSPAKTWYDAAMRKEETKFESWLNFK